MRWHRREPENSAPSPAATLLRVAVLLQGGLTPQDAWRYLADEGDAAARRVAGQRDVAVSLAALGEPWKPAAAAWGLAVIVGAPLSDTLRSLSQVFRDAEDCADEVRVALAEPAATARLMTWLPLCGLLLGFALGFDILRTLLSPLGAGCLVAGVLLLLAARRWSARLVRQASPSPGAPGMDAELLALALRAGVSVSRARGLVADVGQQITEDAERLLALAARTGAPAVELLRTHAAIARQRARTEGRVRAARLGGTLLLPLGVCILPSFLLLGVAPLALSVLDSTVLIR